MFRSDDLVPRLQKRVADKFDQLVGTVAEDHIRARDAEFLRNRLAQVIAAAVRVNVGFLQRGAHRHQGLGRRPERVLIRGELADLRRLQPEFPCDILNRLAGFVGYKITQLGVGGIPDRHKAEYFRVRPIKCKNAALNNQGKRIEK